MQNNQSFKSGTASSTRKINEEKDKWSILQKTLDHGGSLPGELDFSFQILGVYSPPEFLNRLHSSGSVDAWGYTVKLCGAELPGGKYNFRELTEEEKKELDTKKKPPPKINKKDIAALKAEEERIAREQKEKEEKEKEFQAILDKMTPEEQFYYIKEIPTKEAWISWPEGQNITTIKKNGEKYIEFEEDVYIEEGTILELQLIPPPDEDPKKRPKPKGITPEEVKPIYAVSWIDLSKFHNTPGLTEIVLRSKLLTREMYEKRIDDLDQKIHKKIYNPNNSEIQKLIKEESTNNEESSTDFIEKAQTYIYIRIATSQAPVPLIPYDELPKPLDLIKNPPVKRHAMTIEEIEQDLLRQFKIAIAAIAKVYDEAMGDTEKGQIVRMEKENMISNQKKEERENLIGKFFDKFNSSGKADLLKEKLKKFIVKIVREKYGKKGTPVKGVHRNKEDQFYSELYAYLTDAIKQAMNEFVQLKRDELHEDVVVSFNQSKKEIMNYAIRQNKEPEDKRLLRLSKENELLNNYSKSLKYFKARLLLYPNEEAWLAYGNLAKKMEDLPEVERSLTNAITIEGDNTNLNMQIVFCGLLYLKGQINNAINYLYLYILKYELKSTTYIFNAFLSFLYREKIISCLNSNKTAKVPYYESLSKKYWEAAKIQKMRNLPPEERVVPPPPQENEDEEEEKKKKKKENKKNIESEEEVIDITKGNPRLHPEYRFPVLTNAQIDSIWFETANLFNRFNFFEISEKLIKNVTEETKDSLQYKLEESRISFFSKDYNKAIEISDAIIKENPLCYDSYLIKGHALYILNKFKEAEETYIKAIRYKPQEVKFSPEMLVKLGIIYIKNKQWYDAKVIFKQILRDNVEHSFGWRYLGYSLTKLGEYDEAEKALRRANLLDIENPVIWAYLTIYCLSTKKKNQALECLNELSKVNFCDIELMKEIGNLFLDMKEYEVTINIYTKIKNEDITDGSNYLIIAKIYYNNLNKRKEALDVLKSGVDKVINEKQKQEIEFLIEKISREEENLFIGINDDENLNESNNEIEKEKAENNSENVSFSVENNNINSKNNKNIKSKIISENDKEEENDQMKIKDEIKNDNKIEEEKPNDIN
jgi:predicted Zn-dependent protease